MKIKFLGATQTVTGSCFLLEKGNTKILIDCGMYQGQDLVDKNYDEFDFDPSQVDYLIVTHAHLDHVGRIPKLIKEGFDGKILSTGPTKQIAPIVLNDSYHIMEREISSELLFEKEHIDQSLQQWETVDYNEKIKLNEQFEIRFRESGHILGSALVELWSSGNKILFTGDLGNSPAPLLKDPAQINKADYVVMESAYGDRTHEDQSRRKELLENVIENTISSEGTLMIPAFAIERTQELLYELNSLVENSRIPKVPIFIDSPMAIKALSVYRDNKQYFDKEASQLMKQGDDLFKFPGLIFTENEYQSKQINDVQPPKVVVAGAGMSTGGRILHHEMRYLPDPNSCLLLICYQVEGTLGREILEGADKVEIFGKEIPVNAKVKEIGGYSSHADQSQLLSWLETIKEKPKKVFVVQGEAESAEAISQKVRDQLGIETKIPTLGEEIEL
ncbi:MAG: MBL fold metallo-hydrolase [Candidatus Paceibacterota bacterium]